MLICSYWHLRVPLISYTVISYAVRLTIDIFVGPKKHENLIAALDGGAARPQEQKIVVFGWSLGSSVAAFVTSQKPDLVQCVMLGNPFTSIRDLEDLEDLTRSFSGCLRGNPSQNMDCRT